MSPTPDRREVACCGSSPGNGRRPPTVLPRPRTRRGRTTCATPGNRAAHRDDFADAIDFVGWYLNRSHRHLDIAPDDAHSLYLTYYAGLGGYRRGTWRNNSWLKDAAARVDRRSSRYERQLQRCPRLDRRRWWFGYGLLLPTVTPPGIQGERRLSVSPRGTPQGRPRCDDHVLFSSEANPSCA